jgi:hypothetical protein
MAILMAYFDESGIDPREQLCVVAGFVGDVAQWTGFASDWIPAIRPRTNLHMKDIRWHNKRRYPYSVELLEKLGSIPHRYNLTPVKMELRHQDHCEILAGKVESEFTTPYQLCATGCISTVLSEVAGPKDEVLFLFDWQEGKRADDFKRLKALVYDWAKFDKRVKDIDFRRRESTVCLDPADYLAFALLYRDIDPESDRAKASAPILAGERRRGHRYSREHLALLVQNAQTEGMSPMLFEQLRKAGWGEHGPPRG